MWNPFKKSASAPAEYKRYTGTGVCDVCNANLIPGEAFLVPTKIFWDSKKYKAYVSNSPQAKIMLEMAGVTVDQHIAMQKQIDQTENSAVCPDCVHLFQ